MYSKSSRKKDTYYKEHVNTVNETIARAQERIAKNASGASDRGRIKGNPFGQTKAKSPGGRFP